MRKNKVLNYLLIIFNIIIVASLVSVLVNPNKYTYSIYWFIIPVLMLTLLIYISYWSKLGVNSDIDKSKTIQRSFDDITTVSTVIYGLIYLVITFFDTLNEGIRNNVYLIIGYFVITIVYELITYSAVYNAKNETSKLLKEQHSIKNKK